MASTDSITRLAGIKQLAEYDNWIVWREEKRDGKPTKPPRNPKTGGYAKIDDPSTWADLETAIRAYKTGNYDGIGFVFSEQDPFCGLDFDNCRDPETGEVEQWAVELCKRFDSYSEVSPSGRGFHIIIIGKLDGGGRRTGNLPAKWRAGDEAEIEIYDTARYFTVTGDVVENVSNRIEERQEELDELIGDAFPQEGGETTQARQETATTRELDLSDRELIEKAMSANNGDRFSSLWDGDTSGYGDDHSRADQALCNMLAFWTDRDPQRMDQLFRQSGLMRTKWDAKHYSNGDTYGERTIQNAIKATPEGYRPPKERTGGNGEVKEDPGPTPQRGKPKAQKPFRRRAANFTDLGNAERLVDRHGEDLRYCHPKGQWLVWDGRRWKPDDTAEVKRKAKDTVMAMYVQAAKMREDKARQKLIDYARRCESNHKLKAMIELAESEESIPVLPDQLDRNQWFLNVKNGTLDLKTGELRPHKREEFITKIAPVEYNPQARSQLWEDFLEDILPDPEVRAYVQRAAGYSMTGYLADERIFFAYGRPSTGKGTFLSAVQSTMGDYACTSGFEAFLKKRATGGAKPEIAKLDGVRFVASNEVEDGRKLAEALLNTLTGGDEISTRFLYQRSEFEFLPVCKLWLAANNRPTVSSQKSAIWRRLEQVPFDEVIPEDERDPGVKEKLRDTELSGPAILNWLVEGCMEWQEQGLNPPAAVRDLTEEYRQEMDNLKGFFDERCVIEPFARADNTCLWNEYKEWAEDAGIKHPLTQAKFGRELTERGYKKRKSGAYRYREGIGLISDKQE